MCENVYEPDIFILNYLAIRNIVIEDSLDVTIFGYTFQDEPEQMEIDLYTNIDTLKNIIINDIEKGVKALDLIASKSNFESSDSVTIDLEGMLGRPLIFDNIKLKIYETHFQNEEGKWVPDEEMGYIIDEFRVMTN